MTYDALVIGGGPVGLTMTLLLARHGLRVALVEQRRPGQSVLGAVALDDESLRIWQACGLERDLEADWSGGDPGQVVCEYLDSRGRPFIRLHQVSGDLGYPEAVCVHLPTIVEKLRHSVARCGAVDVFSGCTMQDLAQNDSGVRIVCRHDDGSTLVLDGAWCIACDGRNSRTRELLGIPMRGFELPHPWLVADVDDPRPHGSARFTCGSRNAFVTVPLPHSTRRIERMLEADADCERLLADESRVRDLLRPAWEDACTAPIQAVSAMRFHAGIAERWQMGRVLLAGDAAHVSPPFAGQGLATGLRDAANLGFKLAGVCQGWLDERVIETYESERRPHQQRMILLALHLGRVMSPRTRASAFGIHTLLRTLMRVPPIRARLLLRGASTRPVLRSGFITPGGQAGRSIPQPWVETSGARRIRFDELLGPRMTWIATGRGNGASPRSPVMRSSEETLLIENLDFRDPAGAIQRRFGAGSFVLVRPDRVVHTHISPAQAARLQRSRT